MAVQLRSKYNLLIAEFILALLVKYIRVNLIFTWYFLSYRFNPLIM
jgi:hypothetical protein